MKKIIKASRDNRDYYVVHYGWDEGGPESGPIFKSDNIIVKARNAADAENKVANKMNGDLEGCWAEPATQEDIDAFMADMKEAEAEYQSLVDMGLIDPEMDAEMAEIAGGPDFKNMTVSELKDYYNEFLADQDYDLVRNGIYTFNDWFKHLRQTGQR